MSVRLVVITVAVLALGMSAQAATYTWDGTANNWNSPHWLPGPVAWPEDGPDMVINSGSALFSNGTWYLPLPNATNDARFFRLQGP